MIFQEKHTARPSRSKPDLHGDWYSPDSDGDCLFACFKKALQDKKAFMWPISDEALRSGHLSFSVKHSNMSPAERLKQADTPNGHAWPVPGSPLALKKWEDARKSLAYLWANVD